METERKLAPAEAAAADLAPRPGEPDPRAIMRLGETPGHLLRRAQQRAVEIYQREVGDEGLRPPQFALMLSVYQNPGINQTELVRLTGIDRSTVADTVTRLEKRGLIQRKPGKDQRSRRLWVTEAGASAINRDVTAGLRAQEIIMAPIPARDREQFLNLLRLITDLPS